MSTLLVNCDAVREEFRQNGRDSEYCPELENGANKLAPVLQSVSQHFWRSMEGDVACVGLQNSFSSKKERRSAKQQPKECVFCKNNGEESVFYKGHVLKDPDGRVICPVLRIYVCPICNATGDHAHTVKYCPKNSTKEPLLAMPFKSQKHRATGVNKKVLPSMPLAQLTGVVNPKARLV
uniref:Nanos-type domain-containing protein n=1 Tax=Timema monikensis TaxID=170555 RepID=A0A7R9ECG0_9NEOP|nr:unnamed protein product [Timema monikensis]